MKKNIKFSIIVPVYNVGKYIKDCMESLKEQTFKNFEVIVVNDGSTDNSKKILDKYKSDNIKIIKQKNQGLSVARNNGVKQSRGEYLIFLDGDDYLETNALEILDKSIHNEDVIRYQLKEITEEKEIISEVSQTSFSSIKGTEAFEKIVKFKYVENAWLYYYKAEFYKKNNFNFKENYYHEDFGLIPIILMKAKKVSCISNTIYNYRQRNNSIMNTKDLKIQQKKCNDLYKLGLENIEKIFNSKIKNKEIFLSFIANSLIIKGRELTLEEQTKYYNRLKKNKIFDLMLQNSIKRKIKYLIAKHYYTFYLKVIK